MPHSSVPVLAYSTFLITISVKTESILMISEDITKLREREKILDLSISL